jgi:hypothetical protein
MAEDFNSIFGLGDNKTLSAADVAGVALVAIQQLIKTKSLCNVNILSGDDTSILL